ncbi:hypothetical protein [Ectobacillus ponti]|uniref:Uncharacterized protein n=1 Tax=Ectobacillus ponti TaxID=2961894 RepID=A0AA41X7E7_9BACI|nr:hypothetical protein [Ectobacillus ponti]MCP8968568.1 hypothetical protein [Ectobacillus ponti]
MKKREEFSHEKNPQLDGKYEGPINDPMPQGGTAMGVRIDLDPTEPREPRNPFHTVPKPDPGMRELRDRMGGKEV